MAGNGAEEPTPQEQAQPQVAARAAVYIEVILAGTQGKQVYEVSMARELYTQLGLALAALDTPPPKAPVNRKARRAAATKRGSQKGARRKST
jgi:hypothetical protein